MKHLIIIFTLCFLSVTLYGQDKPKERVFVHLDKDCYLAGEDILTKFYVVDGSFAPSGLSTVGYIEISDTERPHIQHKLALEDGRGSGKINIPPTVPTGVYELSAYTRYMRNEKNDVFFKRQIAIINMIQENESDRIDLQSRITPPVPVMPGTVKVTSDKTAYNQREPVRLTFDGLPDDIEDMVVSVVRNDTITVVPQVDYKLWKQNVSSASSGQLSGEWLPEYEGHIINGKITTVGDAPRLTNSEYLTTTVGFVGTDIRVFPGKTDVQAGTVSYHTTGIYGHQELVTSTLLEHKPAGKYRVDIVSPFASTLPEWLPALKINPSNNRLIDRFVGAQLNQAMRIDSVGNKVPFVSLYNLKPIASYDLDEYTRFNSVRQTLVEFILRVVVRRIDGEWRLRVFLENDNKFNNGNTLVLLDGVPLYDHNLIIDYNPYLIKKIEIYDGKYALNHEFFDCIVSFTTHRANLPSIQLGGESQLFVYDCPELPATFGVMPDYPDAASRQSSRPDFRHTLYWEPYAEKTFTAKEKPVIYTSDLTGEYKIIVEGITRQGDVFYGSNTFIVQE